MDHNKGDLLNAIIKLIVEIAGDKYGVLYIMCIIMLVNNSYRDNNFDHEKLIEYFNFLFD